MEQVDCIMLFQGAAWGTTRPLSALLIGTNLRVPFTRQTTVLESHTAYVLSDQSHTLTGLPFLGRHWYAGCGHARIAQREPMAHVSRMPTVHGAQPKREGVRGSPRTLFSALDRKRVARPLRARRSARTSTRRERRGV
jgi:hypothetical protein